MKVIDTPLPEVRVIEPDVFRDDRGFFLETWNRGRYAEAGLPADLRQANVSWSRCGVVRGLHFQHPRPQGKLVYVLDGAVFDVAVDVRVGSPRFGRWWGTELSAESHRQIWVPEGFAHGFCVTSESALFAYLCTQEYAPATDRVLSFDDPEIGIEWPVSDPEVSDKDAGALGLQQLRELGRLPLYQP